ncbi:hypothetical protein QDW19_gp52 [Microbacterium phage AvGardian]|uniref:hypothetical protein n=1 Tax=Microbacterium phage AvGardian TaxID=2725619 RepID=UPI001463BF1C|nr:hypothetical protein QDW19_gp52 [Microbacterium phage AvGardian]QJD49867.1 hypothetical protein SEA_AVGARDIAN_52 [Microbacterium phage AvGardian]
MAELTIESVAEAIDQLVVERGEGYVYPSDEGCYYSFEDGTPGCIVGAVMAKLAPEVYEKVALYEAPVDDGNGGTRRVSVGSVFALDALYGLGLARDFLDVLRDVQTVQDTKGTWGDARRKFVEEVRELRAKDLVAA